MLKISDTYQKYGAKLFLFGCFVMAILLPVHKMSTTIPLVIISFAFLLANKQNILKDRLGKNVIISLGVYLLLHISSIYFSTYKSYGYNDLVIKAPLLLLPVLLSFNASLLEKHKQWIWKAFTYSCLVISLFINLRVVFFLLNDNVLLSNVDLVKYTIIHPSYLAMYFVFSLFVLWDLKTLVSANIKTWLKFLLTLSIIVSLFFLGSRIAFLALAYFISVQLLHYLKWQKAVPLFFLVVVLASIFIWKTPFLNERFSKAFNMLTASSEEVKNYSVDDRIMIWKNVIELIKEKPITGYSTGDYCYHVLKEKHNESGFGKGYWQRLNAHNQVLESQLALGIIGSISFLAIYVFGFVYALKKKEKLLLHFLIVCFLFSLVESIFQSQGGVMFFGFFVGLFLNKSKHISS